MLTRRLAEWLVIVFFMVLIATVFQQIATSMTEQGIASGGPYDNAAAYPRSVAIFMGGLLVLVAVLQGLFAKPSKSDGLALGKIRRPAILLVLFAIYLGSLGYFGYHLSTPPMLAAIMLLGGLRSPIEITTVAIVTSFALAFVFEVFLKIVLPGGIFRLNIPW